MSNTVSKISVSIPTYLYESMTARLGKREVSQYVTQALEEKLITDVVGSKVDAFIALRESLPKYSYSKIMAAKKSGRT